MRKWYPVFLVAIAAAASIIVYPKLPDRVPTHFDIRGNPDGFGPRWVPTVIFPVMILALWGLMRGLPKIDPRRANYAKMQDTYDLVVNLVLTMVTALHLLILAGATGSHVPFVRLIPAVVGVAFIAIGNLLPRAKPNWWFGIRTPWTLSNDRVWERTHRVGGYVMSLIGVFAVISSFFATEVAFVAFMAVAGAMTLGLIAYSYFAWRQETAK
jgi:immunity protein, SdpI family